MWHSGHKHRIGWRNTHWRWRAPCGVFQRHLSSSKASDSAGLIRTAESKPVQPWRRSWAWTGCRSPPWTGTAWPACSGSSRTPGVRSPQSSWWRTRASGSGTFCWEECPSAVIINCIFHTNYGGQASCVFFLLENNIVPKCCSIMCCSYCIKWLAL